MKAQRDMDKGLKEVGSKMVRKAERLERRIAYQACQDDNPRSSM